MNPIDSLYLVIMKIQKSIFGWFFLVFNLAMADTHECPIVTIWVHGSKLTPTIVYKNFFYRKLGINPALSYDTKYSMRTIANILSEVAPQEYCLEHFHFFGWSGRLCFNERKNAAKNLYEALRQLITEYEQRYHQKPKLRIITHSHGGNVVLNLAKVSSKYPIVIDELIMLACPVQEKTKHYLTADCFKKIYAFYSATDIFQIIDLQGLYKKSKTKKIFSERYFDHQDKLHQTIIQINDKSLMHISFLLISFLKHLPNLCKEIDHFYKTIIPSQINYKKMINIKTLPNEVQFVKTIKTL